MKTEALVVLFHQLFQEFIYLSKKITPSNLCGLNFHHTSNVIQSGRHGKATCHGSIL